MSNKLDSALLPRLEAQQKPMIALMAFGCKVGKDGERYFSFDSDVNAMTAFIENNDLTLSTEIFEGCIY